MRPTRTYGEWTALMTVQDRLRSRGRDMALRGLAIGRRIERTSNWIRFPYYHHVFEDERAGFADQLAYLRNFGQFISLDDAVGLLEKADPIDGRYFCLTFDDGLKSCLDGALPLLAESDISATFYVVTSLVGEKLAPDTSVARETFGFKGDETTLDFMSWDDCRQLSQCGMTIGSHTRTHARLAALTVEQARRELGESKAEIERQMGTECRHFCAPYGLPDRDFDGIRHARLAKEAGYGSFATSRRGATLGGDDPFQLRRDHLLASWGRHQLRYFLSRQ